MADTVQQTATLALRGWPADVGTGIQTINSLRIALGLSPLGTASLRFNAASNSQYLPVIGV